MSLRVIHPLIVMAVLLAVAGCVQSEAAPGSPATVSAGSTARVQASDTDTRPFGQYLDTAAEDQDVRLP